VRQAGIVEIMAEKPVKVELRVEDVEQSDLAKEVARIDQVSMRLLGVAEEDVVEIVGDKKTVAKVHVARPEEEGKGLIRIDAFTRRNAGTIVGNSVFVYKAVVSEAKTVVLSFKGIHLIIDDFLAKFLKGTLWGTPLMKENVIEVRVLANPVPFVVVYTEPDGPVKVSGGTEIRVTNTP